MLRTFHLVMITYLGIFVVACGYKSAPFYENARDNNAQQGDSTTSQSIQSIDSKVVTGGEGD